MSPIRRMRHPARGSVLIECALLLPLLLLLTLPVLDYARAMRARLVLSGVARAVAAELARGPVAQPLAQGLQQTVAALDLARDSCLLVTQLVGDGYGNSTLRAQAMWPADCRGNAAAHAMRAQRDLPLLDPGQVAYVVVALRTQPAIFLRGVLSVAAPPSVMQARAVF